MKVFLYLHCYYSSFTCWGSVGKSFASRMVYTLNELFAIDSNNHYLYYPCNTCSVLHNVSETLYGVTVRTPSSFLWSVKQSFPLPFDLLLRGLEVEMHQDSHQPLPLPTVKNDNERAEVIRSRLRARFPWTKFALLPTQPSRTCVTNFLR